MTAWKAATAALDQVKSEELRALTDEESACRFGELGFDSDLVWFSPEREFGNGLAASEITPGFRST